MWIYYLLTFFSGTFIGSFLNLVSDRVVTKESILFGRSHCDTCQKPLTPKNLIPLLSFFFQRGKCSNCGVRLSWYYPLSEFLTGVFFVIAAYLSIIFKEFNTYSLIKFSFLCVVFSFYIVLLLTDLKYYLIPNAVVIPGIIFTLVFILGLKLQAIISTYLRFSQDAFGIYLIKSGLFTWQAISSFSEVGWTLVSTFVICLFFIFLVLLTKGRGMGGGDITLGVFIGLVNGFPGNILAIFLGFVLGSLVSLSLIAYKKKGLKDTVPFGPFLITGSLIALLYGTPIINYYLYQLPRF